MILDEQAMIGEYIVKAGPDVDDRLEMAKMGITGLDGKIEFEWRNPKGDRTIRVSFKREVDLRAAEIAMDTYAWPRSIIEI